MTSTRMHMDIHQPDHDHTATSFLLTLLSTEIARDGGASLVTNIKDYTSAGGISPKRLNSLLVEAIQKPKLMAFLEANDAVFLVDRTVEPHWVTLKSADHVDWSGLEQPQTYDSQLSIVHDKILGSLRHRYAKIERRRKRQQQQQQHTKDDDVTDIPSNRVDSGVNIGWLLRQCTREFHEYLRAAGTYLERIYPNNLRYSDGYVLGNVAIPGTRRWEDLILEEFSSLLLQMATHKGGLVVDAEQSKVWFGEKKGDTLVEDVTTVQNDAEYLKVLDDTLTEFVNQDGATQVRLEVLLHRYQKLKRLLGGRDLWALVQQSQASSNSNTAYFERLGIFKDGPDIILQSRHKNTNGRMSVDNEGLFSVANGKWGAAMAKTMVTCCYKVGWATHHKNSGNGTAASTQHDDITAIDLTASVGGMTLGLAKTRFFSRVIGIEIDPHRASLCRQNMAKHTVGNGNDYIEIRTMDAMHAIANLPRKSCLVIDPPWGGENYKKKTTHQHQLYMGDWTLNDILYKIYHCIRPCIVGLRLPVTFVVADFLEKLNSGLEKEEIHRDSDNHSSRQCYVRSLMVRKMSVQLFVVLYFSVENDE